MSTTIEPEKVKRCGYLPFYHGIFSDHRGMYIDIEAERIFRYAKPDVTRQIYKRFTTGQVKKCQKYIDELINLLKESKIPAKIKALEKEMIDYKNKGEGDIDDMIERCQRLCEKTHQLMIASEKRTGKKPYPKGYAFSGSLKEAAHNVVNTKKKIRKENVKIAVNEQEVQKLREELGKKKQH